MTGTYPVSASTSASILWIGGSAFGAIATMVMDQLRDKNTGQMRSSLLFQGIVALVTGFIVLLYNSGNLRWEAEEEHRKRS